MKKYATFLWDCFRLSFVGDWRYHLWMLVLTLFALAGVYAYCQQFVYGLVTTGMTDQVSWGLYIANFTYLVGLAAAAAMLVIPVYVYRNLHLHDVVIFGELLAVAVIIMCLLFVTVDLGRPDRFMHLLWRFNFPMSMLTWDVIALNGYLLLNLHICGYLIYCAYLGRSPSKLFYVPFVFIAIVWAISIHTVTAFLYVGLGGRPFWNSAIIAPRFLASAFAAGPAFIILTLQVVRRFTTHQVSDDALLTLRRIVQVAMIINMFLLACEVFTEFYTGSAHVASARYLYFGLAWPVRPGAVDLDGGRHEPGGDHAVAPARVPQLELAEYRLRAVDRRDLDREGNGLDRARLCAHAVGRDCRVRAHGARDRDLPGHLGFWAVAVHHFRPHLRAGAGGRSHL